MLFVSPVYVHISSISIIWFSEWEFLKKFTILRSRWYYVQWHKLLAWQKKLSKVTDRQRIRNVKKKLEFLSNEMWKWKPVSIVGKLWTLPDFQVTQDHTSCILLNTSWTDEGSTSHLTPSPPYCTKRYSLEDIGGGKRSDTSARSWLGSKGSLWFSE